jgi:catechol 2,3-dioxygenase-like lactoylglutathione lyase family enzyme
MRILAIEHVQLAMPQGGEARARAFYADLLGLPEVAKPSDLARRGGAWFERDGVKLHLGVEPEFRPARKAHPALQVEGLPELLERLRRAGVSVEEDAGLKGWRRAYVLDPFGNRLELMEALA